MTNIKTENNVIFSEKLPFERDKVFKRIVDHAKNQAILDNIVSNELKKLCMSHAKHAPKGSVFEYGDMICVSISEFLANAEKEPISLNFFTTQLMDGQNRLCECWHRFFVDRQLYDEFKVYINYPIIYNVKIMDIIKAEDIPELDDAFIRKYTSYFSVLDYRFSRRRALSAKLHRPIIDSEDVFQFSDLVYKIAQKMPLCSGAFDFSDLVQEGLMAVIKAISTYNGRSDLMTWCYCQVQGRLMDFSKRMNSTITVTNYGRDKLKKEGGSNLLTCASLDDLTFCTGEDDDGYNEALEYDDKTAENDVVTSLLSTLDEESRQIVADVLGLYDDAKPYAQLSRKYGLSCDVLRKKFCDAINALRAIPGIENLRA